MEQLRISFTGHRAIAGKTSEWMEKDFVRQLKKHLSFLKEDYDDQVEFIFIAGGALGIDTYAAEFAYQNGIELHLWIPFTQAGQELHAKMDEDDIATFRRHIEYCTKFEVVCDIAVESRQNNCYGARNRALVDNSDVLLAYMSRKKSGTGHCVRYGAEKHQGKIWNLYRGEFTDAAMGTK